MRIIDGAPIDSRRRSISQWVVSQAIVSATTPFEKGREAELRHSGIQWQFTCSIQKSLRRIAVSRADNSSSNDREVTRLQNSPIPEIK